MKTFYCIAALLTAVYCSAGLVDYSAQADWEGVCTTGDKQSPIDVVHGDATETYTSDTLVSLGDASESLTATNEDNDNAIKFSFDETMTFTLPGIGYTATVAQLHIHWGADSDTGSEHLLNGVRGVAEAHLVTTYVDSAGDTVYAVVGRVFEEGDADPCVAKMITSQNSTGDDRTISDFNLKEMFPDTISSVITYNGSLTTPTCDEKVFWMVVPDLLTISTEQLEALRTIALGNGTAEAKTFNWRDTQDTNDRTFICYELDSGAIAALTSPLLLLVTLLKLAL